LYKIQQLEFRKIVSLHDGSDLKPELKKTWLQYQSEKVPVKTRIAKFSPLSLFTTAVQISQTLALKHSDNDFVLKTASNQKEAPTMNKQELTDSKLPSLIEVLERGNEKNEEAVGTFMMETDFNQIDEEILQSEESENISEEKSENPAEEVLENKDIINSENLENIENSENTEENPRKTQETEVKRACGRIKTRRNRQTRTNPSRPQRPNPKQRSFDHNRQSRTDKNGSNLKSLIS
jgi:hypothetical protein